MATISTAQKHELQNMLRRVRCGDVVTTNKSYILSLLGRERDRGEAWKELLDLYEGIGGDRDSLHGLDINQQIVLSSSGFTPVIKWTGE